MAGGRWKKNNTSPSSSTSTSTSTSTSSVKKHKRKRPKNKLLPTQNLSSLISLVASATSAAHNFLSQNDLQLHPSQALILESKVTSTALSLTKLNSILSKTTKTPPPLLSLSSSSTSSSSHSSPSPCWFERFLSSASDKSDPRWVEAFRMSKLSFALLLQTLIPHLQKSDSSPTPPDHMLAAALFRLAHATSFNSVGRRFGMDSATACRAFYEVCKAIIDQLGHLFEFPSDLNRIIVGFGWISLPNCCGALGFSRFLVEGGDSEMKDEAALIVQGLVDSEGRFLDVSAGWPGSMSPSVILPHTKLFSRVEESKELLHGPSFQFRDGTSIPQYILGNSSCPLLPWLLTPYPTSSKGDNCNFSKEAFNAVHTRGMKLVSTAFRRIRIRWRLLATKWKEESVESYPFVIVAGCLLHNFLLKCGEPLPEDIVDSSGDVQEEFPMFEGKRNEIGEHIRDALAFQLGLVRRMR